MKNSIELLQLSNMLRELDLKKNDEETIKYVLIYIANEIDKYVENEIEKNI